MNRTIKFLQWCISLLFITGITFLINDGDLTGIAFFLTGAFLAAPFTGRLSEKIFSRNLPLVRIALALCCYLFLHLPFMAGAVVTAGPFPLPAGGAASQGHPVNRGYFNSHWPAEDGGPERLQHVRGVPGPGLTEKNKLGVTKRWTHQANMVLIRKPGEVYLMQTALARGRYCRLPSYSVIEKIDPLTLETVTSSPRLRGGPYWPGGFALHRNGDIYVTFGRWCHRLTSECRLVASCKLPYNRPYNSLIILDNGLLVMKEMSETASHLTILDPVTMKPTAPHVTLKEPSIARISGRGTTVYIVGTRSIFRYTWNNGTKTMDLDNNWIFDYVRKSKKSFGWDPVIGPENAWFLDNGRHGYIIAMLGAAEVDEKVNLVRVSLEDTRDHEILPVSEIIGGTITNPPVFIPGKNIVAAYDSANGIMKAYRHTRGQRLKEIWKKVPFGVSNHMLYFPSTGELCTNDYQWFKGDASVVLDIETGKEKGRVDLGNIFQGVIFSCPGWNRDYYYVTFDRVARVHVTE